MVLFGGIAQFVTDAAGDRFVDRFPEASRNATLYEQVAAPTVLTVTVGAAGSGHA